MSTLRARKGLIAWVAFILLGVVPWASFQGHSHWAKVAWVPFGSGVFGVRDVILNTLFYVPFGYLYARHTGRDGRGVVWRACLYALLLSGFTELSQVYSHRRFPSATDVTCNVGGAILGALWALARRRDQTSRAVILAPEHR